MFNDTPQIKLFISYSHEDEPYFKVFNAGLKKATQNRDKFLWNIWSDSQIYVGTYWDDEIQKNIQDCNVALLLVSVGFMASKYIRDHEFKKFIDRYNDKGILIAPLLFAPADFEQWKELSNFQIFKPKGIDYGHLLSQQFTYADLVNFSKSDASFIPNPNISRYHIDLVNKIEDAFSEFLRRKIADEKNDTNVLKQSPILPNYLSDYPKPSKLFTGRDRELMEFEKIFESSRVFAIEGLGGTGKTEFAAKCIETKLSNKNNIVWLNGSVQSKFDVFVQNMGYGDVLKGEQKTTLALFSGLKDLLERDEKIIFWDNFNDYEDQFFIDFLSFSNQYLFKASIILITKTEPTIPKVTLLPIIKLEGLDQAILYAEKLRDSNPPYKQISNEDIEKICTGSKGHPLAVEFSMWLMSRGKSADDIILNMPEFGIKRVEEFSKRLFLDIFNHPNTSDEERDFFLKCSVLKDKMSEEEINYLFDGVNIFPQLAGLIDKLLISLNNGFYEIHPLIRSFSYEKLVDKKTVHKKVAGFYISKRTSFLNPLLEEKIFFHLYSAEEWIIICDSVEKIGRNCIRQGQLGLLYQQLVKLSEHNFGNALFEIFYGDILQIRGEWNEALKHFKKVKDCLPKSSISIEGLIKFGEVLFRKGDVKEALGYFEEALELSQQMSLQKEEARALNDLGFTYEFFGDNIKARDSLNNALSIRQNIEDNEGVADTLINIGNMYLNTSNFDLALLNYKISLNIYNKFDDKERKALCLNCIGIVYNKQGNSDKAFNILQHGLKIREEIGDKEGIASSLTSLGSLYISEKKYDDALTNFQKSLRISEQINNKLSVSDILNSIAVVYLEQEKNKEAEEYLKKSIQILESAGNKVHIAATYYNLATLQLKNKSFEVSLSNFFKALAITKDTKLVSRLMNNIVGLRESMQLNQFKKFANKAYDEISPEIRHNIPLNELIKEPVIAKPKIGRNDQCTCGSGKKYKQCHGKNLS